MRATFTEQQIQARAVELGLIPEGQPLPRHLRSRVIAALIADRAAKRPTADAPVADRIVVEPGVGVQVDGKPFPWMVQADRIEVALEPDGSGLVRLTLPTHNVQIKPVNESE